RKLVRMVCADAAGSEFERVAQGRVKPVVCLPAGLRCDAPVVLGGEDVLVEALGIFGERLVAERADFAEDVRNGARNVRVALAAAVDEAPELLLEVGIGGGQAQHQAASPSARKRSTSAATRGSVLSAARLTISRAEIDMIVSVSTSPFSASVLPVETRSTIRIDSPSDGASSIAPLSLTHSAWMPCRSNQRLVMFGYFVAIRRWLALPGLYALAVFGSATERRQCPMSRSTGA